ncbi:TSUP family transporter [Streptomyces sp. ADMS]|uniref:TSUP family transporter n=1 Tax=Streptomyces sp. ADMS TaxID=3071415 RepID=UPI00296E916A|nr:TSUP family transporter [Streptomyces sp. ADMS]MDW4910030.1 TSUP family transporter [Streptomyces sp. ADMS]
MLGLGVAFAAVPFLAMFMSDLVDQVQPLSLLLNGITALSAAFGFARGGLIDWRRALGLAAVTTAFAPLGALPAPPATPPNTAETPPPRPMSRVPAAAPT